MNAYKLHRRFVIEPLSYLYFDVKYFLFQLKNGSGKNVSVATLSQISRKKVLRV